MCSGSHGKRPRSTGYDSSRDEPVESPRRDRMDRARAGPTVTLSDLAGT